MKSIRKLITVIQEDILGTDNRFMAGAWLACLIGLVALGIYLSSESRSFLGYADSREQQISFEYPVSIKQLHVITGQAVRKGELLMELDQSELHERIRLLRAQLDRLQSERALRQQLNLIVNNGTAGDLADPLSVDIEELSDQMDNLEEQKRKLFVFSQVDGIVGAVNYRQGEKVPGFTSILTLTPNSPTYVEGFVHETLNTKLEIGKKVTITPVSSQTAAIEGKIVSVGSRIIQIPVRLMSYPNMQVWGREVVVEIPPQNGLLLGEKVQIKPKFEFISLSKATASTMREASQLSATEPQDMTVPSSLTRQYAFEPSGAVYLSDIKKFLVISDDTDKKKTATLFLVNADGTVEDQVLKIPGLGKVSDLESISQQGSTLYLLTSQGVNKSGKEKKNRNQFIRVVRTGLSLNQAESVDFKSILLAALKGSSDKNLQALLHGAAQGRFEIEGHYIQGTTLFVGFKEPLLDSGESLIVAIKDFETIFSNKSLAADQISTSAVVAFENVDGRPHHLSELVSIHNQVYAATVCDDETCGAVWHLRSEGGRVTASLIKFYGGHKPEGLAFHPALKTLFVTFDEKDKNAKFARIDIHIGAESSENSLAAQK